MNTNLPLETINVAVANCIWQITCVRNRAGLAADSGQWEQDLFGFLLWEAAVGLAQHLSQLGDQIDGKSVLELGAGVGLPGLVAHSLGAQVTQTDYKAEALALAEQNARQNQIFDITTFLADWRAWRHAKRYDLILGADILYDASLHFYLESIFHKNLRPGGRLLLSDPGRPQALDFALQLEEHGWSLDLATIMVAPMWQDGASSPIDITLIAARR